MISSVVNVLVLEKVSYLNKAGRGAGWALMFRRPLRLRIWSPDMSYYLGIAPGRRKRPPLKLGRLGCDRIRPVTRGVVPTGSIGMIWEVITYMIPPLYPSQAASPEPPSAIRFSSCGLFFANSPVNRVRSRSHIGFTARRYATTWTSERLQTRCPRRIAPRSPRHQRCPANTDRQTA